MSDEQSSYRSVRVRSTMAVSSCLALLCGLVACAAEVDDDQRCVSGDPTQRAAKLEPGDLDRRFADNGLALTELRGGVTEPAALAVQSNGKILVAAGTAGDASDRDFVLLRFQRNGTLDRSFGDDGVVVTDFFGGQDQAFDIAIQDDGAIVVAGHAYNPDSGSRDFALVRYTRHGAVDTEFGEDGKVVTDFFRNTDDGMEVAIQDDGKIVMAGGSFNWDTQWDMAVVRYTADGELDTSFSDDGRVVIDFFGMQDGATTVLLHDQRIFLAGNAFKRPGISDFAVVALDQDGNMDPGFGDGGKVLVDFAGGQDEAFALAALPDGDIAVGGRALGTQFDFALARLHGDGRLDESFGDDGVVQTDIGHTLDQAFDLVVQPDGKLILIGFTYMGSYDLALARYDQSGALDDSFGMGGLVATDIAGNHDRAWAAALQRDGKLLLAGAAGIESVEPDRLAVARYVTECP